MGQPPIYMRINRIFLELIASSRTRTCSILEESAKLMTAMLDYETEINLESITQEIER